MTRKRRSRMRRIGGVGRRGEIGGGKGGRRGGIKGGR